MAFLVRVILGINHPRNFWKFWNCPCFTRSISKFSKMHLGKLSQIALPNMGLLVVTTIMKKFFRNILNPLMSNIPKWSDTNFKRVSDYLEHKVSNNYISTSGCNMLKYWWILKWIKGATKYEKFLETPKTSDFW